MTKKKRKRLTAEERRDLIVRKAIDLFARQGFRATRVLDIADAVGTSDSIADCLRMTRPRGRVVLMGMPAQVSVDLTGLWHRETQLVGAYTYGTETMPDGARRRTFDLAIETAQELGFERLLSATYRLDDHDDAIAHAAAAGRRGAVKIAFDLRPSPTTSVSKTPVSKKESA